MALNARDFRVGQQVVAMTFPGVPCQCNSQNHPDHPCRVTLVKIGRTKVHGFMSGDRARPTAMTVPALPDARGLIAYPVEEAKRLYEAELRKGGRSEEDIRSYVDSL